MTDFIDHASELEQRQREQAITAQLSQTTKTHSANQNNWGVRHCQDCGISISTARLIAAPQATRCIECQGDYEHQQKRGAYG